MQGVPPGGRVSDYEYDLPPGRIARYPAERRDESRLLVVPRQPGVGEGREGREAELGGGARLFRHLRFRDLVELVRPGDVLVVNESRVIPARLLGRKPTGAASEILLLRPTADADPADPRTWEALVRPGGKLKPGRRVVVADDLAVEILDSTAGGGRVVRLEGPGQALDALERHGHVPLPPYLEREDEPLDRERYQTVYARTPGSIAAPTAGLHFTPELLVALDARGVRSVEVILEVGIGTFRPRRGRRPRRARDAPGAVGGRAGRGCGDQPCARLGWALLGGRDHRGADAGVGGGRAGRHPPGRWRDPPLHPAALPVPCGGRADYEFPPSPLDPAHAGRGVHRLRARDGGVPGRGPGGVPLLLVRRRDGGRAVTSVPPVFLRRTPDHFGAWLRVVRGPSRDKPGALP